MNNPLIFLYHVILHLCDYSILLLYDVNQPQLLEVTFYFTISIYKLTITLINFYLNRVPLSLDVKEVLEVAYVSKVMSKNFRKEGQPEKERIAHITGVDIEKVSDIIHTSIHSPFKSSLNTVNKRYIYICRPLNSNTY